jgi:hypothetical protein
MSLERMKLVGVDRARYFVPTTICVSLAILCAALILTSAFLTGVPDAIAVTAAGVFGLLLSGGLGLLFWYAQRRDLQYMRVATASDAPSNFAAVRSAAQRAGWRILREDPARGLEAQTPLSMLDVGERVQVQFRDSDVLVASICDPSIGFSLVGRRHCAEHRELVRQAVLSAD